MQQPQNQQQQYQHPPQPQQQQAMHQQQPMQQYQQPQQQMQQYQPQQAPSQQQPQYQQQTAAPQQQQGANYTQYNPQMPQQYVKPQPLPLPPQYQMAQLQLLQQQQQQQLRQQQQPLSLPQQQQQQQNPYNNYNAMVSPPTQQTMGQPMPSQGYQPSQQMGYGTPNPQVQNNQLNKASVVPVQNTPPMAAGWQNTLCGCMDDFFICGNGTYLPSCLYGEIHRKIYNDGFCGACCLYYWCSCFSCCFANKTRAALRAKYNLQPEPCGDCLVHFFCGPCALCQEARELRVRERWQTWQ